MARRTRIAVPPISIEETSEQIKVLLVSPLQNIGTELESQLRFLESAARKDTGNEDLLKIFLSQVGTIFRILPATFGDRFWFDAQMIDAIAQAWNGTSQRLSGTILPKAGREWAHGSAFIPLASGSEKRKAINVINVPGRDDLIDIDLLGYPWMCHELAHNLFYYNDTLFVDSFKKTLDDFLGTLRLRAIADQGSARSKSHAMIDRIAQFWEPALTHKNWAHEMAMDIVALWTCGPAFLAAFQDEIEDKTKDPYHLDNIHPPYAVRAIALLRASKALGWTSHAKGIEGIKGEWRKSKWARRVDNDYLALAEPRLTEAVVDCTLATCTKFSLPRCTPAEVARIEGIVTRDETPQFGSDLILAAWFARDKRGAESFNQWERSTIRFALDSLTP